MGQKLSKRRARQDDLTVLVFSRKPVEAKGKELQIPTSPVDTLIKKGEFAEAVKLGEDTIEQHKNDFGLEDRRTLLSMFEFGKALHGDGRIGKALQTFQELLPLNEKVLGPWHPDTLCTLDAICEELCNMGKYELSLTHLIDERERCEKAIGLQAERTIQVLIDIAHICQLLGRSEDASSTFLEALERSKKAFGNNHNLTLAVLHDIRQSQKPSSPDRRQMEITLQRVGLPVPDVPFSRTKSCSFEDTMAGESKPNISMRFSAGYEATTAAALRFGDQRPPVFIPPYYTNEPASDKSSPSNQESGLGDLIDFDTESTVSNSPPQDALFRSLVERSMWGLDPNQQNILRNMKSLEDLLSSKQHRFWFFQFRASFMEQSTFQRWDPNSLDRYILLPVEGGATTESCLFISHYWRTPSHPDPNGDDLRQLQQLLRDGFWSSAAYIWVDWTCLPQWRRTDAQQQYFTRILPTIPRLVRDCTFMPLFTDFQPRLWVLFEIAAYNFHRADPVRLRGADTFAKHLSQMKGPGVRFILDRYGYRCTNKGDREWVITWLEILIILREKVPSLHVRRQILNTIDNPTTRSCICHENGFEINMEKGWMKVYDTFYQFNPFSIEEEQSHSASVSIGGDYGLRLEKAQRRADDSFDKSGVGDIARECDQAGDYAIAENLYRRAMSSQKNIADSQFLAENLEKQHRYVEAVAQCQESLSLCFPPEADSGTNNEINMKLRALIQKVELQKWYNSWKSKPLEAFLQLQFEASSRTTMFTKAIPEFTRKELAVWNGMRRSYLQRLDQNIWQCMDPVEMKAMEERGARLEQAGSFVEAMETYWSLLRWVKVSLGPCHVDTRRGITNLARAARLAGFLPSAYRFYVIALAVRDFTLGPSHPESRTALGDVAEAALLQQKLGIAKGYYRQLLERTLAVVDWDDPEAFQAKFFLHALTEDTVMLEITLANEKTSVVICVAEGTTAVDLDARLNRPSDFSFGRAKVLVDAEDPVSLSYVNMIAWKGTRQ